MSRRLSRLAYSLATATFLHLAACGSDGAAPAQFAKASDLQKERAIIAGAGMDAGLALFLGSAYGSAPTTSTCPRVARSGDTVTVTTGCTSSSGDKLSGSVIAKNPPPFLGGGTYDPAQPSVVTFEGFRIDDSSDDNEDFALDGQVTLATTGAMTADLIVTMAGLEVRSAGTWTRTADRSSASAGSTIELTGLGEAEIQGAWNMDSDAPGGAIELHGVDVLRADFDRIAAGCAPLTVDGVASGQICQDTSDTE